MASVEPSLTPRYNVKLGSTHLLVLVILKVKFREVSISNIAVSKKPFLLLEVDTLKYEKSKINIISSKQGLTKSMNRN